MAGKQEVAATPGVTAPPRRVETLRVEATPRRYIPLEKRSGLLSISGAVDGGKVERMLFVKDKVVRKGDGSASGRVQSSDGGKAVEFRNARAVAGGRHEVWRCVSSPSGSL